MMGRKHYQKLLKELCDRFSAQGFVLEEELSTMLPSWADANLQQRLTRDLRQRGIEVGTNELAESLPSNEAGWWEENDMLRMYLDEMSRISLLSAEEEKELARRVQQGRAAQQRLSHGNFSLHSAEKRRLEALVEDGLQARDQLIRANTRLVVSCAKKYIGHGVPLLDLIQEGNLGLMKAVEKYDVERGFRFSTYATWWIRQMISRAVYNQARTIRLPVHIGDRLRKIYRSIGLLEQRLGRPPSRAELAEELDWDIARIEQTLHSAVFPLSLDEPVGEDEENELGMFIGDEHSQGPVQSVYLNVMREEIQKLLDTLPAREALILRLRYGLWDGVFYTLEEVGQKFGLTRERIRQIEMQALRRLRQPCCARRLKEYLG